MRKVRDLFVLLIAFSALTGCSVMKQTSIEVLRPAKLSLPETIRNIVLVDNTQKQPSHLGNKSYVTYYKNDQFVREVDGVDTVDVDSLGMSVIYNAANTLLETGYYDTVIVWKQNVARSNINWVSQRLNAAQIGQISLQTGADAIFSLDVFSYENSFNMNLNQFGTVNNILVAVSSKALWRFYDLKNNKYIQHKVFTDSISLSGFLYVDDYGLPTPEEMLGDAAWRMGSVSGTAMTPKWSKVERVYYNDGAYEFKLADKYLRAGENDKFKEIMMAMYQNGKRKVKARAAFNLCFYCEIKDELKEANDWIDISVELYKEINKRGLLDRESDMSRTYKRVIANRIKEQDLLGEQLQFDRVVN